MEFDYDDSAASAMSFDDVYNYDASDEEIAMLYPKYISDFGLEDMDHNSADSHIQSISELISFCVYPILTGDELSNLAFLFGMCFLLRISVAFLRTLNLSPRVAQFFSVTAGVYVLYVFLHIQLSLYFVGFAILFYFLLVLLRRLFEEVTIGFIVLGLCFAAYLSAELFMLSSTEFVKLRGAHMILVMKIISVGFDVGSITSLSMLEYLDYVLSPHTLIFGPWISYAQHHRLSTSSVIQPLGYVLRSLTDLVVSLFCLIYSVCVIDFLFPSGMGSNWTATQYLSSQIFLPDWIRSYADAQSFRFSHYFVCFISSGTLHLAGYIPDETDFSEITTPLRIELPRSLVDVVVGWNIPMHVWLKRYIFVPFRNVFPNKIFIAILATYVASSLLHGFNFQLSAILLSLGLYTFAEHKLRATVARAYSACVSAKPCPLSGCNHRKTSLHIFTLFINGLFRALAVFHLAYLGCVFSADIEVQEHGFSMAHTLNRWRSLGFYSSHIVAGITLLLAISL